HDSHRDRARRVPLAGTRHGDVGQLPRRGRVARIVGPDEGDAVLEVERVDHVALALVQVDGAGMDRRRSLAGAGAAQHSTRSGLYDRDLSTRGTADVYGR